MSEIKEVDFFFLRPMLRHDWDWYQALFAPEDGEAIRPVRGEISPHYTRLKRWQVEAVARALPGLRIVLTLRHPIERAWSQTLYEFGRLQQRDVREVSKLELLRQLERPRNFLSSDYIRVVKTWWEAFGREALYIGYFEQLRDEPEEFVGEVLKHIGAATPWSIPDEFRKNKVWATKSLVSHERNMPAVVRWYIADQLLEPTRQLNDLLQGRVSHWVEELRTIRGQTRLSWKMLAEVNRAILSVPERVAYKVYHGALDVRLRRRWRKLWERPSQQPKNAVKEIIPGQNRVDRNLS